MVADFFKTIKLTFEMENNNLKQGCLSPEGLFAKSILSSDTNDLDVNQFIEDFVNRHVSESDSFDIFKLEFRFTISKLFCFSDGNQLDNVLSIKEGVVNNARFLSVTNQKKLIKIGMTVIG